MAVPLRADFDAVGVRCWARKSKDGPQARRLLALAAAVMRSQSDGSGQDWRGDATRSFAIGCSSSTPMVRRV